MSGDDGSYYVEDNNDDVDIEIHQGQLNGEFGGMLNNQMNNDTSQVMDTSQVQYNVDTSLFAESNRDMVMGSYDPNGAQMNISPSPQNIMFPDVSIDYDNDTLRNINNMPQDMEPGNADKDIQEQYRQQNHKSALPSRDITPNISGLNEILNAKEKNLTDEKKDGLTIQIDDDDDKMDQSDDPQVQMVKLEDVDDQTLKLKLDNRQEDAGD